MLQNYTIHLPDGIAKTIGYQYVNIKLTRIPNKEESYLSMLFSVFQATKLQNNLYYTK